MPRKLKSDLDYPTGYTGAVIYLVDITTDVATHRFGTARVAYNDFPYSPFLILDSPVRRYRSLQADVAEIKLANTCDEIEALLLSEKFEGAKCTLLEYFADLDDAAELVRGVLSEQTAGEDVATWRLIPEYDFKAITVPERNFSTTCSWRFKSDPCGYVDGVDPDDPLTSEPFVICTKDYAACVARGRTHRFNGFVQITTQLTKIYPPAGYGGGGRTGGGAGYGGGGVMLR